MSDFTKVIGLLGAITQGTKRLLDAREEFKINEIAIHLQGIVLDLQSEMMVIQSRHQDVLRSCEDLKGDLKKYETWEQEKSRYFLESAGGGSFVYALKEEHKTTEPAHWLCTSCYDKKQKSILQRVSYTPTVYQCPVCNMKVFPLKTLT